MTATQPQPTATAGQTATGLPSASLSEALRLGGRMGGEDTLFYVSDPNKGGIWYLCDRPSEVASHRPHPEKRLAEWDSTVLF